MKNAFLCLLLLIVALTACQNNQKQQPSEAEIEKMVNERVEAKLAEKATDQSTISNVEGNATSNYGTTSEISSAPSSDRAKKLYDVGVSRGSMDDLDLEWYLKNNEENLKNTYRSFCRNEELTNKFLYQQFRKGFLEGYKLKDAL